MPRLRALRLTPELSRRRASFTNAFAAIANAGKEVEGKTEIEAVIAYLQVLGTAVK